MRESFYKSHSIASRGVLTYESQSRSMFQEIVLALNGSLIALREHGVVDKLGDFRWLFVDVEQTKVNASSDDSESDEKDTRDPYGKVQGAAKATGRRTHLNYWLISATPIRWHNFGLDRKFEWLRSNLQSYQQKQVPAAQRHMIRSFWVRCGWNKMEFTCEILRSDLTKNL